MFEGIFLIRVDNIIVYESEEYVKQEIKELCTKDVKKEDNAQCQEAYKKEEKTNTY